MESWYALTISPNHEERAAGFLRHFADKELYSCCRIPKKKRVFRSRGALYILEDIMFPGYVLVRTAHPKALAVEMRKSGVFPQFISFEAVNRGTQKRTKLEEFITWPAHKSDMLPEPTPLEDADIVFLKNVCGESLEDVMGISRVALDSQNRIIRVDGILDQYLDQIVRMNLHKRFAVVEVALFNRMQQIAFGICLEQDSAALTG